MFAGLETGAGKAFCAASVAMRLARHWRCLAIELDDHGNLQGYLSLNPSDRKVLTSVEDLGSSLESLKTRTGVANIDFIGWPGAFPKIDRFLGALRSDPSDYVFATLAPGVSDDGLELFAVADVSVLVTQPGHSAERILEFLQRLAIRDANHRDVYILLNQVRRGGEEREITAFVEKARIDLGLKVRIIGTVVYDPQAAGRFVQGATISGFDDIAIKIERVLPRTPTLPAVAHGGSGKKRGGMFAAVASPFGRKRRQLEETLRQRDLTVKTLQRRHESMVDDLQEMLKQKNEDIADKANLIEALEEEVRRYTQQLLEQNKRIADLDAGLVARQRDLERSSKQIHDMEGANSQLSKEKAALVREGEIASRHLAEFAAAQSSLEGTVADLRRELQLVQEQNARQLLESTTRIQNLESLILQEKAAMQLQEEDFKIELERAAANLEENRAGREHLGDQVRQLQESNSLLIAEKIENEESVRRLSDQLGEKKNCVTDLENRLAVMQVDLQRLEDEVGRFEESSTILAREKTGLEETVRGLAGKLNEKSNSLTDLETLMVDLHVDRQRLQDEILRLEESQKVLSAEKSGVEETVRVLTQREGDLRGDVMRFQDEVSRLEESNAFLVKEKSGIEETVRVMTQREDDLRGDLLRFQEEIRRLEESRAVLAREKAGVDEAVRALTQREGDLRNDLLRLQDEIRRLEESRSALATEKAGVEEVVRALTQREGDLRNDLLRLQDEISLLEESRSLLAAGKAGVEQTVRTLTEQISEKANCITALENRVASQEMDILRLHDGIHLLEESGTVLTTENTGLEETIRGLTGELIEKANCIAELEVRLTQQQADLQEVQQQLQQENRHLGELNDILRNEKSLLQNQKETLELARDDVSRKLAEAETMLRERNYSIECKDLVIRELRDHFAELSSGHEGLASRTSEALARLYDELRLSREGAMATVEKWHGLVSAMEDRTKALSAHAQDTVAQKDGVIRQLEETYSRELSCLHQLQNEKDTAIDRLEKTLRIVEENNYQLKFDRVTNLETKARRPGPESLIRQREGLVTMLRTQSGLSATVIGMDEGGRDGFLFAIELRSILESAGWNVKFLTSAFENGEFFGLQVVRDGSKVAASTGRLLCEALEQFGFAFILKTAPSPNLSPLRLIVGKCNW